MEHRNRKTITTFLPASLWLFSIYACIPFARSISDALRKQHLLNVTLAVIGCIALLFTYRTVRRTTINFRAIAKILLIICLLTFLPYPLLRGNEELIHFVQYGTLSFLIARALRGNKHSLLYSFCISVFAGFLDEVIQYVMPHRFFDVYDILLNAYGAIIGLYLVKAISENTES